LIRFIDVVNYYHMTYSLFPNLMEDKNEITIAPSDADTGISLKLIVNSMVGQLTGAIIQNNIRIENRLLPGLRVYSNQSKAAPVIFDMLACIISNARDTTLSIDAEKFVDTITLTIEDRNTFNGYALAFSLMAIEIEARSAGGFLNTSNVQKRIATVSFSFPDQARPDHIN
jgi:hypothetical protein